jgi:tetratricopeptide (TPR) repeat protein
VGNRSESLQGRHGSHLMLKQRPGWSILRLLTAFFVLACSASALLGQNASSEDVAANFQALAKSATAAREAGEPEEAIRDYQRALEIRPDWQEGWWFLGALQYDQNHYAEAASSFQKLVQLAPDAGPAWSFLGLCEFETKDYSNALSHLEKAQTLGTGDDQELARVSAYHLALLIIRNGEFEQASTLLASMFGQSKVSEQVKVALGLALLRVPLLPDEVDPSQDALIHAAGEVASMLMQGDSAKALEAFPNLLTQYPRTPYLHYAYGMALAAAGQLQQALAQQHQETKFSPDSALPWIQSSALELRLQHPQEAQHAAEMAVQLAPRSSAAHRQLSESLRALGKIEKADEELRLAETFSPEKPQGDARIAALYANHSAATSTAPAQPAANAASATPVDFDVVSRNAVAFQAAGNAEAAIQSYQQALQLRPDWDEGQWSLAMLYYSTNQYPQAITALKSWVARKPGDGTAWAVMGLSDFAIKDYNNALVHLQRGRELGFGGSAEAVQLAKYRLGVLLIRNSEFENATDLLAPEAGPGPLAREIQFALGMSLLRISLLPEQVEQSKKPLVQSAGEIAELLQNSKYDAAFLKFQELLPQYPTTPFLHYAYGTALASLSRYDDAEAQLHQELSISPQSALPYLRLAAIALRQHRPQEALPSAQHAVQLAPDSGEAHYLLGRAYLETGKDEMAVHELETAARLSPGSPEVHFNLAKAYAKAKLPEKADQERAIFVCLNALAEQQRSLHGSQSYEGPHDQGDFSAASGNTPPPPQ